MMLLPTAYASIASTVERGANALLKYEPSARAKLASVKDQVFQIELKDLNIFVSARYDSGETLRIKILPEAALSDAHLSGTLKDFLIFSVKSQRNLAGTGISMSGSVHLVQLYAELFQTLDIDWEDALAQTLDPSLSHLLASSLKKLVATISSNIHYLNTNTQRYIQDELNMLVSEHQAAHFYDRVAQTRSHVDRLEARLALLQAQIREQQKI